MIFELGIGIANLIFRLALIAFWKRALHLVNINIDQELDVRIDVCYGQACQTEGPSHASHMGHISIVMRATTAILTVK